MVPLLTMTHINREKLKELSVREEQRFVSEHLKSAEMYARARKSLLGGVPMNWMKKWAGAFPVFVAHAKGAHFTDVDGREYVDLCLGDTGAMTGHSPDVVAEAVAKRVSEGITLMLPTEDSVWVGEELKRRFGLPYWQFALTATDANRFAIRIAREITQRSKILVYNYCYHGTVDESFASLDDGLVGPRRGNIGPPVNPVETTRVVEFNDLNGLEDALKQQCCGGASRAGYDECWNYLAGSGLLDGGARADAGIWRAADCGRDAHYLCRPGRLHTRVEAGAGLCGVRETDWQRDSWLDLWVH